MCEEEYYLASLRQCSACTNIPHCIKRQCTSSTDQMCLSCEGDYGSDIGQAYLNKGPVCEENCSWRTTSTTCYPGSCSDGENSCVCETGFTEYDCTTLEASEAPSFDYCLAKLHDESGGTIELTCINGSEISYTNQPNLTFLENDWRSSYKQPTVTFPPYITNFKLGMIRGITIAIIYDDAGTTSKEVARIGCSDSATRNSPNQALYHCADSSRINLSGWTIAHRDRIDVQVEVENGGYVTVEDPDAPSQFKKYYNGITLTRTGSFTFDFLDPLHCRTTGGCSISIFTCGNDVTKKGNITVSWSTGTSGWTDPDSGINRYKYEIRKMSVQSDGKLEEVLTGDPVAIGETNGGTQLLPHPGLYSVVLEVFDVAGNVQLARRFILFDDINNVTFKLDTSLKVTSASPDTGFEWLTDLHSNVQVDWTNHYINEFHDVNKLLNEIGDYHSTELASAYDQWNGTRGRNAIPNKLGVVKFEDTYSLDHSGCATCSQGMWNDIGLSTSESYNIPRIDGDSITFWVQGTDVMNNTLIDSVKVHVDSSDAIIQDLWLVKDGERNIAVHSSADLLEMEFEFQTFDAHSGLKTIHWELYDVHEETKISLGSDHLSADHVSDALSCLPPDCICIPKGDCYGINYSFKPDMSRMNISDVKHDQEIYVKITVTNQAMLIANLTRKVSVDTSPPHDGAVYDGSPGENEIDFQQELQVAAHWSGFFDKESGIKYYKYGFSDRCLSIDDFYNVNVTTLKTTSTFSTWTAPSTGKYYCTVIAFNNAVDPSNPVCSDGVTIDNSSPTIYDVFVENLYIRPGLVRNVDNSTVWYINQDLKKSVVQNPSDTCISLSRALDEENLSLIPAVFSNGTINSISDLECLQNKPLSTYSYLREDRYLSAIWTGVDNESEIFDYMVGLSSTPSITGPDLVPFKSTGGHPILKTYHPHLGEGVEFFIIIKAINRAKMFTTIMIGPIIVDVTPPSFTGDIYVRLDEEYLLAEWNADCFIDDEDDEPLTYYVAVGHSPGTTELLPFEPINETAPCTTISNTSKLCTAIWLYRLDWELHVNHAYFVSIKAINVAGLTTIGVSEPYYHTNALPTLGVVFDVSVRQSRPTPPKNYVDIDCQSEKDAIAVYWYGFQNVHDEVSYQVAVGSTPGNSDVTKGLVDVGSDDFVEIRNLDLSDFKVYYTTVIALSLAGSVSVSSDGVAILPKEAMIYGTTVADGEPCSTNGSCIHDVDFQSSPTSYSSHWHIASNMTSLVTHVIWTMEKEIDGKKSIFFCFCFFVVDALVRWFHSFKLSLDVYSHVKLEENQNWNKGDVDYSQQKSSLHAVWPTLRYFSYEWSVIGVSPSEYTPNFNPVGIDKPCSHPNKITCGETDNEYINVEKLNLKHGSKYFICIHADETTKHYEEWTDVLPALSSCSDGVVIDHTPPSRGDVWLGWQRGDIYQHSTTELSINWDSFVDVEEHGTAPHHSGIKSYQYAVGTYPGGIDVIDFVDVGITNHVLVHNMNLHNGQTYFVTVKATDFVGLTSLSTSQGITVDSTPPTLSYNSIRVDDGVFYSTSSVEASWDGVFIDHESGISTYEWSIGSKPYWADIYPNTFTSSEGAITNENYPLNLQEGHHYYITVKAYNGAGLSSMACSGAIIVDTSPPSAGFVYDGPLKSPPEDQDIQQDISTIFVNWGGFVDRGTQIISYSWKIGLCPGCDDVMEEQHVGVATDAMADYLDLIAGFTYYPTVTACDAVDLCTEVTSDGVLVDNSPPVAGFVFDGSSGADINFQNSRRILEAHWWGFNDPHSGLSHFEWWAGTAPGGSDIMGIRKHHLSETVFTTLNTDLPLHTRIYVTVRAYNKAGQTAERTSDGFVIDTTAPQIIRSIKMSTSAGVAAQETQVFKSLLHVTWEFADTESGVERQYLSVFTHHNGDVDIPLTKVGGSEVDYTFTDLALQDGSRYQVKVVACNAAELCTEMSTQQILVDSTPPTVGTFAVDTDHAADLDRHQ
ncbi:uncharacterized protein LOC117122905, partial [Anneissia japonica]|uniref:uncharacterized protein LOC117122905 n=1 Tax=Anneissia japonica TaxID=1529436 RepID=UPI0014258251